MSDRSAQTGKPKQSKFRFRGSVIANFPVGPNATKDPWRRPDIRRTGLKRLGVPNGESRPANRGSRPARSRDASTVVKKRTAIPSCSLAATSSRIGSCPGGVIVVQNFGRKIPRPDNNPFTGVRRGRCRTIQCRRQSFDADPGEAPVQRKVIRPHDQASDGGVGAVGVDFVRFGDTAASQPGVHRSGWLLPPCGMVLAIAVWTTTPFAS